MQIPEGKGRPFIVFLDDEPAHLEQGLYIAVKAAQAAAEANKQSDEKEKGEDAS